MLNNNFALKDLGYSTAEDSSQYPRHRWYFFKEAFSPKIVEKAIENTNCKKGDLIIDPFCGSGTVATTATFSGMRSVSFEVNPFFKTMAETKLGILDSVVIDKHISNVNAGIRKGKRSPLEGFSTFSEIPKLKKWLFNTEVLRSFEGGWMASEDSPKSVKNIIRLCLLSAAMDSCNAIRDGKCLRYREDWKKEKHSKKTFKDSFEKKLELVKNDLDKPSEDYVKGKVHLGDVRKIGREKLNEKFKLCVTSPPYLNSFDYSDVYRPELFLGKYVNSNADLMKLRLKTLRSHVQAKWDLPVEDDFGSVYSSVIRDINNNQDSLWAKRIPKMIQAYFEDMRIILRTLREKALPSASLWIVVSTSAYGGVHIPVDLILSEIGGQVGWYLREVGVLRYLRCSGQHLKNFADDKNKLTQLRESVIIFDATKPRKTNLKVIPNRMG